MKHIATQLFEPYKKNERLQARRYYCKLEGDCPLLAQGKCIHVGFMQNCEYGKAAFTDGPTRRAKSYTQFKNATREESSKFSPVNTYRDDEGMAYIGEYVYLPYTFICNAYGTNKLPMNAHSGFLQRGSLFMKRQFFDAEMVVKILQFRPQDLLGGEITDYQNIHMPRFARDLKRIDSELYAQAKAIYPQIDEVAHRAQKQPLPIWELGNFTGKVLVDGRKGYWYGSHLEIELSSVNGVSHDGPVKVDFKPTKDVMCVIVDDKKHIKRQEILRKSHDCAVKSTVAIKVT